MSPGSILAGAFGYGDIGGGVASPAEVIRPAPDVEVVCAAGTWAGIGPYNIQVLASRINSSHEKLDVRVIEAMLDDDAVKPALDLVKLRALSGKLKFHPSVEEGGDPEAGDPEEARRAAERCRRNHDRLPVPIPIWGRDALNALAFGHKAAEVVKEYIPTSETSGEWMLSSLNMKPHWSYELCTDPFFNLVALWCQTPIGSAYVGIERFAVWSWDVRDEDPRGSSILRAAKDPWRRKQRAKDSRSKGDDQFGTPSISHELPPDTPIESTDPITGARRATVEVVNDQLGAFQNGSTFVHGHGGSVKTIESQRDGKQLDTSIDSYDRAITKAILLSAMATIQAKHYTQGGADNGDDLIDSLAACVREWFLVPIRRVFWSILADNAPEGYDPADYADRYTPRLSIGRSLDPNFGPLVNSLAVMGQAGLLTPSQVEDILAEAGVSRPKPGELRIGPSGPIPDKLPTPAEMQPPRPMPPAGDKP